MSPESFVDTPDYVTDPVTSENASDDTISSYIPVDTSAQVTLEHTSKDVLAKGILEVSSVDAIAPVSIITAPTCILDSESCANVQEDVIEQGFLENAVSTAKDVMATVTPHNSHEPQVPSVSGSAHIASLLGESVVAPEPTTSTDYKSLSLDISDSVLVDLIEVNGSNDDSLADIDFSTCQFLDLQCVEVPYIEVKSTLSGTNNIHTEQINRETNHVSSQNQDETKSDCNNVLSDHNYLKNIKENGPLCRRQAAQNKTFKR